MPAFIIPRTSALTETALSTAYEIIIDPSALAQTNLSAVGVNIPGGTSATTAKVGKAGIVIGNLQNIEWTERRATASLFQVGSDVMVERIPALTEPSLTFRRAELYREPLMTALGFRIPGPLVSQRIPFKIRAAQRDHSVSPALAAERSIFQTKIGKTKVYSLIEEFDGCWFENIGTKVDMTGNLIVMTDVTVAATSHRIQQPKNDLSTFFSLVTDNYTITDAFPIPSGAIDTGTQKVIFGNSQFAIPVGTLS